SKLEFQLQYSNEADEVISSNIISVDLGSTLITPEFVGFKSYSGLNYIPDSQYEITDKYQRNYGSHFYNLMLTQGHSLREKMVLFWHNHFVSELSVVNLPQRMYRQNKLFREFAFGNFKELTKEITIDPAMLIYLDNTKNRKENPNENYARELMELFTLGIGNYSETDIAEAAKALTGWQVEGLDSYFDSERFDNSQKTFMNETGNFGYTDIIEIIFKNPVVAKHLCRKLYKEFVYFEVDGTIIDQLATILRDNNYELKPVLSTLLKSEFFYSPEIVGAKIKSPVELIIPLIRQFRITKPDYENLRNIANDIGQTLYSPPNVAGWVGDKAWINTNTLPARNIFSDRIISGSKSSLDILEYSRTFDSSENALQFVDDVTDLFLSYKISENRKAYLLDTLLDGAEIYDWSTYNENSKARLESFFKAVCRLSEYQLI
ncbi:MAG: DUF1800 domain-containing protein, partial [Melioribacteraceae bacterium]|nr:DUF1800 domain-containing protein [Melioribacteraceae bacterium]